jgi:hypothetical protein
VGQKESPSDLVATPAFGPRSDRARAPAQRETTPMSGSSLGASIPILSFDPIEQIMFVGFAGLKVETAPQIQIIFDAIDRF